jgi:uncharacterized membrane protein YfcA
MSATELVLILMIGLAGGLAGGLLGIGGSIVMIPLLTLTLGANQQLYQAACMIVNVVVAVGASMRHYRAGSVRKDHFRWMFPAAGVMVIVGVLCGNLVPTDSLKRLFALFLLYTSASEAVRLWRAHPEPDPEDSVSHTGRSLTIGGLTGLIAGLLGVGGGTVAVPLLRRAARLPLRQAIGTSSAVMTLASVVGATAKNLSVATLHAPDGSPLTLRMSLMLAVSLAGPALLGAHLGASLNYRLPLHAVRLAFVVLIGVAGLRMMGWLGS